MSSKIAEDTSNVHDFLSRIISSSETVDLHFPSTMDVLLDYFRAYVSSLEKHLETERIATQKRFEEAFDPEVRDYLEEHLFVIEDIFPNLLRSSFVASVYTALENGLRNRCRCLQELKSFPFSADEIAGRGYLQKYRTYIERLTGIDFERIAGWKQLELYGEIRNRIVHHQGDLNLQNTNLVNFINADPDLRIEDGKIVLEQGACQALIDIVHEFFNVLDKQLPAECSDLEPHFGFRP